MAFEQFLNEVEDIFPTLVATAEKHYRETPMNKHDYLCSLVNTLISTPKGLTCISGEVNRQNYATRDTQCRGSFNVSYMSAQMVKAFATADENDLNHASTMANANRAQNDCRVIGTISSPIYNHEYLSFASSLDSNQTLRLNSIEPYVELQLKTLEKAQTESFTK